MTDSDRYVVLREDQLPVDSGGFDNFHFWLGQVREMRMRFEFGTSNKWLEQLCAAVAAGHKVTACIEGDCGAYSAVVWALPPGSSKSEVVWGVPTFRFPQDVEAIVAELKDLVAAIKAKQGGGGGVATPFGGGGAALRGVQPFEIDESNLEEGPAGVWTGTLGDAPPLDTARGPDNDMLFGEFDAEVEAYEQRERANAVDP